VVEASDEELKSVNGVTEAVITAIREELGRFSGSESVLTFPFFLLNIYFCCCYL